MKIIPGEYYTVVVLGNGFDLNLGLKTRYSDFIESNFFTQQLLNGNYICQQLKGLHVPGNWIDVEKLLKAISKYSTVPIRNDFTALCTSLTDYINNIDYGAINANSKAWEFLENISKLKIVILDFNYTDTTEILLKKFNYTDETIKERLIKVHGCAKDKNIIFGVEDDAEINVRDIFLKKSINENFHSFHLTNVTGGNRQLQFFGHSLGETDHSYFQDFFDIHTTKPENKKITIYGYGDQGCDELYQQLDTLTRHRIGNLRRNSIFQMIDCTKNN